MNKSYITLYLEFTVNRRIGFMEYKDINNIEEASEDELLKIEEEENDQY